MITCTRKHSFEAGHRVFGHESKCASLHGHSYLAEITAALVQNPDKLDRIGRVVDFSIIKQLVCAWIDNNLDHKMLLCKHDPIVPHWVILEQQYEPFLMPEWAENPTAENIAKLIAFEGNYIFHLQGILKRVYISRVVVHETRNCRATYDFSFTEKEERFIEEMVLQRIK